MSDVFVTTYKITGASQAIADRHWDEIARVRQTHMNFAHSHGALAYRPGVNGTVGTMLFPDDVVPGSAYRGTGQAHYLDGKLLKEWEPRGNTKEGKALRLVFDQTEQLPRDLTLIAQFGWTKDRVFPKSGNKMYRPTICGVSFPENQTFLRLPRKANDGWGGHPDLVAIPEDELMMVFHQHHQHSEDKND